MINIDKERLLAMIASKTLPGNTLYWVSGVRTVEEANRTASAAFEYLALYRPRVR